MKQDKFDIEKTISHIDWNGTKYVRQETTMKIEWFVLTQDGQHLPLDKYLINDFETRYKKRELQLSADSHTWTTNPPTLAGIYWFRRIDIPELGREEWSTPELVEVFAITRAVGNPILYFGPYTQTPYFGDSQPVPAELEDIQWSANPVLEPIF